MTETRINMYEAMFLFPQTATADLAGALDHVESILGRAGAEIVSICKWDERRLAYDIKGNKRGLYFLVYFKADRAKIAGIERDCNLSEQLLRAMVLRADHVPTEEIEAANGRTALADEIKLRAERGEDESRPKVTAVSLEEEAAAKEAAVATADDDSDSDSDDSGDDDA
jgi:small subunit ribosomal protein S6